MSFNNALGTINLAVTLVSASKVYLVEGDTPLNAGGLAEKQDLTAIASRARGTFVFREHDINATQSVGSVGAFTVAGGIVSNGNKDINRGGTLSSLTFTGSFNAPDSTTGRGSGTFTDTSPATSSFFYYIVDANNVRFLAGDVGVVGSGRAELQSGTPALSGSYAFGSKGDTGFPERREYGRTLHRQRRSNHRRRARFGAGWKLRRQRQFHRHLYPGTKRSRRVNPQHGCEQQFRGLDGQSHARTLSGQ